MEFGCFVLLYSFMKILRMMMAATVLMALSLVVCKISGHNNWRLNLGMFSLVPFACLMGYSKIFFTGRLWMFTNWLQGNVTVKMAVCYFIIAGILFVRHLYMQRCLHERISCMQRLEEEVFAPGRKDRKLKIRVYLSKECGSPFAGGVCRPFIVIPLCVKNSLSKEEFSAVLSHEVLHIRQGHVLLLTIYAWLKIIWWPHPLIYMLERKLRENLEYSCDEGSVMLGPLSACEYANVILKTLQMERQDSFVSEGIMTFYDSCYAVLKKRVERLGSLRKDSCAQQEYCKRKRRAMIQNIAAGLLAAAIVIGTSMPRYTQMEEISVFDDKLHPLTYDLKKEGFHAEVTDHTFSISEREMQKIAKKYQLHGEYVVFSYHTIMKVPGVGGLGQAAKVRVDDASDVCLLARQEWMDRLQAFVLKYLI